MKIIKEPKFKHQTCMQCRAVVEIKPKDLHSLNSPYYIAGWTCPLCKCENQVEFDEKVKEKDIDLQ